jgi:Secretion system C-terminal sorting domain
MKKTLFIFILFVFTPNILWAQVENNPCSAFCLPASGIVNSKNPDADGFSPNVTFPCGGGTSEDNPTWYTFVASANVFELSLAVNGCSSFNASPTVQITVFEGSDCNDVSSIGCLNCVSKGMLTVQTIPLRQYWIQVDGCAEAVCDYTLTYDPKLILINASSLSITGPTVACIGTTNSYTPNIGVNGGAATWKWYRKDNPSAILQNTNKKSIELLAVKEDSFDLCVETVLNTKCPTIGTAIACISIKNYTLKPIICDVKLCGNQLPFTINLDTCLKTTNPFLENITYQPSIVDFPQDKDTTLNIAFHNLQKGCKGEFKVNISTRKSDTYLGEFEIGGCDSIKIIDKYWTFKDVKTTKQFYKVGKIVNDCDSTVSFFLKPKKTSVINLGKLTVGYCDSIEVGRKWLKCDDATSTETYIFKKSKIGCDTIFTYTLDCLQSDTFSIGDVIVCDYDSVLVNGSMKQCSDANSAIQLYKIKKLKSNCNDYVQYKLTCLKSFYISEQVVLGTSTQKVLLLNSFYKKQYPHLDANLFSPQQFNYTVSKVGSFGFQIPFTYAGSSCKAGITLEVQVIKPTTTITESPTTTTKTTVNIRPNPFDTDLTIMIENADNQSFTIELIDVLGRKMASKAVFTDKTTTAVRFENLQFLERGFYIVVVRDEYGKVVMKKVVKE